MSVGRAKPLMAVCLLFLSLILSGCSSEEAAPVQPVDSSALKAKLEAVAKEGRPLGSAAMDLRSGVDNLRTSDPAKADELSKDLKELETMSNPAKIKAKASAMAAKL